MEQNDLVMMLLDRIEQLSQLNGILTEKLSKYENTEEERFEQVRVELDISKDFLQKKIEDCPFNARIQNVLKDQNISFIQELIEIPKKDFYKIPKLGVASFRKIEDFLAENNLSIGDKIINEDGKLYRLENRPCIKVKYWERKVLCLETGEVFASINACSNKMNIPYMTIRNCIEKGNKCKYGYTFKEVD